jgi:DNA-binding transcriptional LysR family regulator
VRLAVLQVEAALTARTTLDLWSLRRAFRVVIADFLTPLLMPGILAKIQAVAPGVQLHIEPVTDASARRLVNGDVDACYWPYDLSLFGLSALPPGLRVKRLGPSPWMCIASPHHHDLSTGLTQEEYIALRHVVPRPSLGADNVAAVWKRLFLVDLNIAASTNSMLDLAPIVAASNLVATVPEPLLELISPQLAVQSCLAPLRVPTPYESLLWHRRYDEEPAHAWLRELFATARTRADRLNSDSDPTCTDRAWRRRCTSLGSR